MRRPSTIPCPKYDIWWKDNTPGSWCTVNLNRCAGGLSSSCRTRSLMVSSQRARTCLNSRFESIRHRHTITHCTHHPISPSQNNIAGATCRGWWPFHHRWWAPSASAAPTELHNRTKKTVSECTPNCPAQCCGCPENSGVPNTWKQDSTLPQCKIKQRGLRGMQQIKYIPLGLATGRSSAMGCAGSWSGNMISKKPRKKHLRYEKKISLSEYGIMKRFGLWSLQKMLQEHKKFRI